MRSFLSHRHRGDAASGGLLVLITIFVVIALYFAIAQPGWFGGNRDVDIEINKPPDVVVEDRTPDVIIDPPDINVEND